MFEPGRFVGGARICFSNATLYIVLACMASLCAVPLRDLAHVQRMSSLVNGLVQRKPLHLSMNMAGFRQRHLDTKVRTWRGVEIVVYLLCLLECLINCTHSKTTACIHAPC